MPSHQSGHQVPSKLSFPTLTTAIAAIMMTSCGYHYRDVPRTPSTSLEQIPKTGVAGKVQAAAERHPGKSGFAVIEGTREAFTDRIALADFAQKTIDVQYYIWSADTIGLMLGDRLIQAADRGVRVRFLLDDVNFKERDEATAALAAHPNIEVRIFNPHRSRGFRTAEFLSNFSRLNKRMHNKLMVMDNSIAVIGGRNIADEYFGLGESFNNRDLDIAAAGPIVREISTTFDEFWNSEASVPIEGFVKELPDMDDFRRQIQVMRGNIRPERYPFPLDQDIAKLHESVDEVLDRMVWTKGEVLHDSYKSMLGEDPDGRMDRRLIAEVAAAKEKVKIEAAYFVMRDRAIEIFEDLEKRGVDVQVLTNALAGNDVIAAQAGHTKRRPQVLRAGVDLYEMRPDAPVMLDQVADFAKDSRAALHSKAFVIDGKTSFIGSFNFDPRSADINSEFGLLVHGEEFAKQVEAFLDEAVRPENAYRLSLDEKGRSVWTTKVDGETKTWTKDPETTWGRRAMNQFMTWLPIENQL